LVISHQKTVRFSLNYKRQLNNNCLDAGLYICLNCDVYPPSTNKNDWLDHTQQYHQHEFAELEESQKILTNQCKRIKVDHD
jgi:hypothetical protein